MAEMTTPEYKVDEKDPRLQKVLTDKEKAMSEIDGIYDGQINANNSTLNTLKSDLEKSQAEQNKIVNQQTDLAIKQINQDKAQAQKDYIREQSGAWADYQKATDPYGVNAERMAAQGLDNSGFKESSMVSMYNQYQNRVAVARESYNKVVMNYNNKIAEAKLQNSSLLAEIAKETLQQQLELTVQFTQMNNTLITQKASAKATLSQNWWDRYQDVYKNIQDENALAESVRQYNEDMKFKREQWDYQVNKDKQSEFNSVKADNTERGKKGAKAAGKDSNDIRSGKSSKSTKTSFTMSPVKTKTGDAYNALNQMIKNGANKDYIANQIALALREGAITSKEAQQLRNTFTPRGVQY